MLSISLSTWFLTSLRHLKGIQRYRAVGLPDAASMSEERLRHDLSPALLCYVEIRETTCDFSLPMTIQLR